MLNDEQRELVISNMGLVYSAAIQKRVVADEDAIQYGFLGLCKAAERYDKNLGIKFSTFAYSYIIRYVDGLYGDIKHRKHIKNGTYIYTDDITRYKEEITNGIDSFIFLKDIISKVDECSQKILLMLYEGYKHKEITKMLNISSAKYYSKIKNIKERFNNGEQENSKKRR